tara:strand:- start:179 stop:328 length:150 start_codon:yes stop_codon:yes gene_type:complete
MSKATKTILLVVGGIIVFATLRGGIDWKNIKNWSLWKKGSGGPNKGDEN